MRKHIVPIGMLLCVVLTGLPGAAQALPRYSALYGQRCGLCHIDPTGGGQRTLYAVQYLIPTEMTALRLPGKVLEEIDPRLGRNLTAGADLRTIYHHSDGDAPGMENFLQMQGSVYLTFQPLPRVAVHLSRGQSQTTEAFGLGYYLPLSGYAKVGRFVPAYGWRLADHTQFARQLLGWSPPGPADVGVEVGFHPGPLEMSASVTNGNRGSILDEDRRVAYAARALWRDQFGPVQVGTGGSLWADEEPLGERLDRGPFGYVSTGPFTWIAEAAWSSLARRPGDGGGERTAWITSQELTWRVHQGIDLRVTYDFYDPDLDRRSGARARLGGGLELFPIPFLAIHTMVRGDRFDSGDDPVPALEVDGSNLTWFELQVHFLY